MAVLTERRPYPTVVVHTHLVMRHIELRRVAAEGEVRLAGCMPYWVGVSGGSEVGAAAVSRPPVVDEAPLVAVRADGDVFAS